MCYDDGRLLVVATKYKPSRPPSILISPFSPSWLLACASADALPNPSRASQILVQETDLFGDDGNVVRSSVAHNILHPSRRACDRKRWRMELLLHSLILPNAVWRRQLEYGYVQAYTPGSGKNP